MTNAPYLLPGARAGYRMGNGELLDALIHDGLWCAFDAVHMGSGTERYAGSVRRHHPRGPGRARGQEPRARRRGDQGRPLRRRDRAGRRSRSARATRSSSTSDEGVRPGTTTESLGGLRPAFEKDGTITAGNASQISDGAAAVVVTSREKADELGAHADRRARELRHGRRPRHVAAHAAVARDQARARADRRHGLRHRPVRAQRGVRRRRARVDARPRHHRRHRQRQRRRDRARPPDRHVGHARS